MQDGQDIIPLSKGTPNWKNRFPDAVAFVETFDTDDDAEPADILSFESLREAFATLQYAETELAKTIPEIELSAEHKPEAPEQPNYEINDDDIDLADETRLLSREIEKPVTAGIRFETVIEAMLFVGNRENRPLPADQIAEKLRNVSVEEVDRAVVQLNEHYQEQNCPYTIISECSGYRMILRSEFESVRTNFYGKIRETRLSQQTIDVLAVVAYRQPITAEEIQKIRKQPCSATLNQLVRRGLLKIDRDVQNNEKIVHYRTTSRFLELFRIKSLDDIPQAEEWNHYS